MSSANLKVLAVARNFIAAQCANRNISAEGVLRSEHHLQHLTHTTNTDTSFNQAFRIDGDDRSLLAQYLLYRF
jgi:hypothetical protein